MRKSKNEKLKVAGGLTVIGAGLVVVGGCIGYSICHKHYGLKRIDKGISKFNKELGSVLVDLREKFVNADDVYIDITTTPIAACDLGELGKRMVKTPDYNENVKYTHFIVMGDKIK